MFKGRGRDREKNAFLDRMHREIDLATYRKDEVLLDFVTADRLTEIWTQTRLEEFVRLVKPGFKEEFIHHVRTRLLRTLSILVSIGWEDWPRFGKIFVDLIDHRSDERIRQYTSDEPDRSYSLDELEDPRFLGRFWAKKFLQQKYAFSPIVIKEGDTLVCDQRWRLPFINTESVEIGEGGYGQVTKETIAPGQFMFQSEEPLRRTVNKGEFPVARKRFANRHEFQKEFQILNKLRSSLSHHDHIVKFYAAVTVGSDFSILSPLADMDLEVLLCGKRPDLVPTFTTYDLLCQAANVAGALKFLHKGLQIDKPGRKCCHMDLKPANILVFLEGGYPVGKWKISDFGISIISWPDSERESYTDTVRTEPRRRQGPYQAPEVSTPNGVGRRSDVWSFGCILTRILALGLEGHDALQRLDQARAKEGDHVSDHSHDYFHRGSPPSLNPHIKAWVEGLPNRYDRQFYEFSSKCKELLMSTFEIDKDSRPTSSEVQSKLLHIMNLPHPRPDQGRSSVETPGSRDRTSRTDSVSHVHSGRASSATSIEEPDPRMNANDTPLVRAIKRDDPERVQALLGTRPDLDLQSRDSGRETPLTLAASKGNATIVEMLLTAGADINAMSGRGMNALMTAARHGCESVVELLLRNGADCDAFSADGFSCLHYAAIGKGGGNIIRRLLENIDVDISSHSNGDTPLLYAVKFYENDNKWEERFVELLNAGADVNKADDGRNTPLSVAVEKGCFFLAKRLVKHGARWDRDIPKDLPSSTVRMLKENRLETRRDSVPRLPLLPRWNTSLLG